jgi:branched-chain amino acid transport system ATP-binding protein
VQHLNAGYGHSQVLFNLSLLAPSRGAVAILGRNGAGKSTLLKTIAGEISPMSGIIWFDQRHTGEEASERRVRRGLGYVPQENAIFGRMTVQENLLLGAINQKDKSGIERDLQSFRSLVSGSDRPPPRCRAANARCSRSGARWSGDQNFSCWTSQPKACGSA